MFDYNSEDDNSFELPWGLPPDPVALTASSTPPDEQSVPGTPPAAEQDADEEQGGSDGYESASSMSTHGTPTIEDSQQPPPIDRSTRSTPDVAVTGPRLGGFSGLSPVPSVPAYRRFKIVYDSQTATQDDSQFATFPDMDLDEQQPTEEEEPRRKRRLNTPEKELATPQPSKRRATRRYSTVFQSDESVELPTRRSLSPLSARVRRSPGGTKRFKRGELQSRKHVPCIPSTEPQGNGTSPSPAGHSASGSPVSQPTTGSRSPISPLLAPSPPVYENNNPAPTLQFRLKRKPQFSSPSAEVQVQRECEGDKEKPNSVSITDFKYLEEEEYPEGISRNYVGTRVGGGAFSEIDVTVAKDRLGFGGGSETSLIYAAFCQHVKSVLIQYEIYQKSRDVELWNSAVLTICRSAFLPHGVRKHLVDGPMDRKTGRLLWYQKRRFLWHGVDTIVLSLMRSQREQFRKARAQIEALKGDPNSCWVEVE